MASTRNTLIETATCLFAERGYDAVGVLEIVETAGVTKPTLYHHFKNKLGLFEAIIAYHSATLLPRVQQAATYEHDIIANIQKLVQTYFTYAQEYPTFYRLLLAANFAPPNSETYPFIAALQDEQFHLFESLFEQATEDHGNMRGRQQRYAVSLRGTIDTYIGVALQGNLALSQPNLTHDIVHQFMHGIFS